MYEHVAVYAHSPIDDIIYQKNVFFIYLFNFLILFG